MNPLSDEVLGRLANVVLRPEVPGGRYELLEVVGAGGMGTVYRARDRALAREVAIKVAHHRHTGAVLDEQLRDEARTVAALEHPSITPIYDIGTLADGRAYYVMRFVHGATLTSSAPGSVNARLRLFLHLCEAVAHAHERGLVHRDLKPANVMLGNHGELYVMDWGIARALAQDSTSGDAPESAAGTPGFMAPEQQIPGGAAIDARVDVYALGGILAYLATSRGPDRQGALDLAGAPKPLAAIIECARRPRPEARYSSAQELARDVAAYLDREPVAAYREPMRERVRRFAVKHQFVIWLVAGYLTLRVLVLLLYRR